MLDAWGRSDAHYAWVGIRDVAAVLRPADLRALPYPLAGYAVGNAVQVSVLRHALADAGRVRAEAALLRLATLPDTAERLRAAHIAAHGPYAEAPAACGDDYYITWEGEPRPMPRRNSLAPAS